MHLGLNDLVAETECGKLLSKSEFLTPLSLYLTICPEDVYHETER